MIKGGLEVSNTELFQYFIARIFLFREFYKVVQVTIWLWLWQALIIIFGHLVPFPTSCSSSVVTMNSIGYSCIVGWEQFYYYNTDYQDVFIDTLQLAVHFDQIFLKPSTMGQSEYLQVCSYRRQRWYCPLMIWVPATLVTTGHWDHVHLIIIRHWYLSPWPGGGGGTQGGWGGQS